MPRFYRSNRFMKFRKSTTNTPVCYRKCDINSHRNWFVTMERVHGTAYMKKFHLRYKDCTFVEYYHTLNPDSTYNIYAYVQLKRAISSHLFIGYFNCRTTIEPTTIFEKIGSSFDKVPGKICLGEENVRGFESSSGLRGQRLQVAKIPLTIRFNPLYVPPAVSAALSEVLSTDNAIKS